VTGDLVNLGLPDEYGLALRFLESLGPGENVSMVPGNHDAYVRGTALLHIDLWKNYITGDGADAKRHIGTSAFPFLRRRGDVAIIGLSTAIPTAPLLATGKLGKPASSASRSSRNSPASCARPRPKAASALSSFIIRRSGVTRRMKC